MKETYIEIDQLLKGKEMPDGILPKDVTQKVLDESPDYFSMVLNITCEGKMIQCSHDIPEDLYHWIIKKVEEVSV